MRFLFHPEAAEEFLSAIDYYEGCGVGLGADFAAEVRATFESITSFPKAWPIIERGIHRA